MTYLFNRYFSVDTAGDLVLTTSPPTSDNSTDVATTAYVQNVLATVYNPANVTVTGGAINGTTVGATTQALGNFTTVSFSGNLTLSTLTGGNLTTSSALVEATRVVTAAGNVTMTATDVAIVLRKTTGAATTVTLPASPTVGRYVLVKDGKGDAATNGISVVAPGILTIDGSASFAINTNYGYGGFIYDGTQWSAFTIIGTTFTESTEGTIVTTVGPVINASTVVGQPVSGSTVNQWQLTANQQILLNNTTTLGANVVSLAYHNHGLFQHAILTGSYDDWWYWDTTLAPPNWTEFAISSVTLSANTYAASAPAGSIIGNISVAMTNSGPLSTWAGAITVSDTTHFKIVGNQLQANATLSASSYSITLTATPNIVGNAFTTTTLTVSQISAGQGSYPFLMVFEPAGNARTYSTMIGMPPDASNNPSDGTYVGLDGANVGSWTQWSQFGFPVIMQTSHFTDGQQPPQNAFPNPVAAANGSYNTAYRNGIIANVGNAAQYIYAIRIDWEWAGNHYAFSPFAASGSAGSGSFASPWYSAATFIKGWRQFVDTLKSDARWAHVKIAWDYPLMWQAAGSTNPLDYYPAYASDTANGGLAGDKTTYVDLICDDPYFGWFDGNTSSASWTNRLNGFGGNGFGLNGLATFAHAQGKQIGFFEWGDGYNDGFCIDQFATWCKTTVPTNFPGTNVVVLAWFNGGNGGDATGQLGDDNLDNSAKPVRLQHYVSNFGPNTMGSSYTGTYWTHLNNAGTRPSGI